MTPFNLVQVIMAHFKRKRFKRRNVKKTMKMKSKKSIDKAQSKAILRLMRQQKADRPEMKYAVDRLGFGAAHNLAPYVNPPISLTIQNYFAHETLGNRGTGTGEYIGQVIKPVRFRVSITVRNASTTVLQDFGIVAGWFNIGMLDNSDSDTSLKLHDEASIIHQFEFLDQAVPVGGASFPQWFRGVKVKDTHQNAAADNKLIGKDFFKLISKRVYRLAPTSATDIGNTINNYRNLEFNFKFMPNARWILPSGSIGTPFALTKGWVPSVQVISLTTIPNSHSILSTQRLWYTDV